MKINMSIVGWLLGCVSSLQAIAQTPPAPIQGMPQQQTEEIIIRKKGDNNKTITVEISGDKIVVNGKPLAMFNEEGITINKRKMMIKDGDKMMINIDGKVIDLEKNLEALNNIDPNNIEKITVLRGNKPFNSNESSSYTFLGVSTDKNEAGASITEVSNESPAAKAGLQKNDIIYQVNKAKIDGPESLSTTIRALKEGEKATIYYIREGKKKDVKVTLGLRKETTVINSFSYDMPNGGRKMFDFGGPDNGSENGFFAPGNNNMMVIGRKPKLGLTIQDIDAANGVKVVSVEPGTAAATAGVLKDDVIISIAGKTVLNTDEAREQLQLNKEVNSYDILLKRNGVDVKVTIKIPKKIKTVSL